MNILLDGWLVFFYNWNIAVWILLVITLGYVITLSILKIIFGDTLTTAEYFSFSLAGCLLPVLFGALFIFSLNIFQRTDLSILILLALISLAILLPRHREKKTPVPSSRSTLAVLILIFFVSIFFRLVFISKAITPLYFDSAEHYKVIRYLLGIYRASQSILQEGLSTSRYYHLGFHLITAVMPSSIQWYVMDTMMMLGQIILAIIPMPIFFIIRHGTSSDKAGYFAVLLASVGWYMPAYAVNWGKYPALTSLIVLQFILSVAYTISQSKNILSKQWKMYILLGFGILAAGLVHTRSVIIIVIAFVSWKIATWWINSSKPIQCVLLCLIFSGILAEYILIQSIDVLKVVFDPYIQNGYVITIPIIVLSIFAFRKFPHLALSSILAILFLLASLFIPIDLLSSDYGYQTILDRPFVEMILYFPLALLGGLGFAGLEQYLFSIIKKWGNSHKAARLLTSTFLLGSILLYMVINYNFYPSDCCQIVSNDDLVAFDWIKRNLPLDSQILISTAELNVFASNIPEGFTGSDAGIWIPTLVARATFGKPNTLDFSQESTLNMLCKQEVNYIYIGGTQQSFNESQLKTHPDWYQNIFFLPKTQVYRITGCATN